jgi:C-terminal processing protease CtpA/Prc
MRKLAVLFLTTFLVAGCGSSSDDPVTGPPTACSNDGQKQFVLDALYDWWLWNDMLPADRSEINIADYESPFWLVVEVTEFYGPRDAMGEPIDRFSYVDSLEADQQFFGAGEYEGFGFRWGIEDEQVMRVKGVFPGSPSAAAGFERGHAVVALNGRTIADIWATEGVVGIGTITDDNDTIDFSVERLDGSTYNAVITKDIVTIIPIPEWRTISIGDGVPPVGYMQFEAFVSTADPVFDQVFAEFNAAGVNDVIIDMRYNGGGLVDTAELLGDYLGGFANDGLVFSNTEFNADRAPQYNSTDRFSRRGNSLDTMRLIVIASGGTASASELVTNSMIPYADVWIVGENTFGKPVGQVGIDFCTDQILRPTAFRTTNANGDGDYFDGLPVDCPAEDDYTIPVGDVNDPRLVAALSVAETGACPVVAAPLGQQLPEIKPQVRYPFMRGSAAREAGLL